MSLSFSILSCTQYFDLFLDELPESSSSCPPKTKSTTRKKIKPNQKEVFSFADDKENEPESKFLKLIILKLHAFSSL